MLLFGMSRSPTNHPEPLRGPDSKNAPLRVFAGRFAAGKKVHRSIKKLQPGDSLELRERDGKWELLDSSGNLVGRMARAFKPRPGMRIRETSVAAVINRVEADSEPEFLEYVRVPQWEVVIPQFVLELKGTGTSATRSSDRAAKSSER